MTPLQERILTVLRAARSGQGKMTAAEIVKVLKRSPVSGPLNAHMLAGPLKSLHAKGLVEKQTSVRGTIRIGIREVPRKINHWSAAKQETGQ